MMNLWIVDDDLNHLHTLKRAFSKSENNISITVFSSLEEFHKEVVLAQTSNILPPDLVVADYDFKREGTWISYIKKFFLNSSFPYRYMILSQVIDPKEILQIRSSDPSSLYVKMKKFDSNFQDFLSIDNIYADIVGDLLSASTNPDTVRKKYRIPQDFASGKTNDVLNLIIKKSGIGKNEICADIDLSIDSFNKMKSRLNQKMGKYNLEIGTENGCGYKLIESDRT